MDIIGQNWIRFENNRKVKYRCSRSDFIVSGRFFDRGTWNYPELRGSGGSNPSLSANDRKVGWVANECLQPFLFSGWTNLSGAV